MPRIRTVKPEFWQDTRLSRMPALDRLVFLCLISMSDDEGRIEGDAETLQRFGFPREDSRSLASVLERLQEATRIMLYASRGNPYIALLNFGKHQKVDHPTGSRLPAPPEVGAHVHSRESSRGVPGVSGIRDQVSGPEAEATGHATEPKNSRTADKEVDVRPRQSDDLDGTDDPMPAKPSKTPRRALISNPALDAYRAAWSGTYRAKCPVLGVQAMAVANTAQDKAGGEEAWKAAVSRYFKDRDKWLTSKQHPLEFLAGRLERYVGDAPARPRETVHVGGPKPEGGGA